VSDERGAALIGTLAIGFVVVLVVGQSLVALGRLSSAAADAADVASYAAQQGARYGGPAEAAAVARRLLPGAVVITGSDGDRLSVEIRVSVPLIGPEGSPIEETGIGRAASEFSPYRSRP